MPTRSVARCSNRPPATGVSGPGWPAGQGTAAAQLHLQLRAHRKDRKGDFRSLWIQRINAAARAEGMTYNRFISGLKAARVSKVDRKMLAELAVNDAPAFGKLVELAKKNHSPALYLPAPPKPRHSLPPLCLGVSQQNTTHCADAIRWKLPIFG